MAADENLWDVFCATEGKFINNVVSVTEPTTCPNNALHTIRSVSLSSVISDLTVSAPSVTTSLNLIHRTDVPPADNVFRIYCNNGKLYLKNSVGVTFVISNDNDRQMISTNIPAAAAAIKFTDIPGMVVTTSNISARNYRVYFNGTIGVKNGNNVYIDFIVSVNDVDLLDSMRTITIDSTNTKRIVHFMYMTAPLNTGQTIKIKWRGVGSSRTKEISERMLLIEGDVADSHCVRIITTS